jgi:hypothetical protein
MMLDHDAVLLPSNGILLIGCSSAGMTEAETVRDICRTSAFCVC